MKFFMGVVLAGLVAAAPAQAHDWYTGLMNRQGVSCCNDRDCHPVDSCRLSSGAEGIHVLGMCRPIPWDLVLSVPSPDGRHHACWWTFNGPYGPEPRFRCIILAGGA
jgi:hypothetical protein